jgi:hypothetical protein
MWPAGLALAAPAVTESALACAVRPAEPGAPYYTIDLVATGRVPGTRQANGEALVSFGGSPFGVAVNADGRYVYELNVAFRGLEARGGDYVVWVTTADLSEVRLAGRLEEGMNLAATVDWNKFLVVVTLETPGAELQSTWQGPIVFRGMSRSGRMHTMAGHGPYQAEPCAKYGY